MEHAASGPALTPVAIAAVRIEDAFWSPRLATWRSVTITDALDKFEKDGVLRNFDRARDGTCGEHGGPPWYDGMLYEMIRGAADFLAYEHDPVLEERIDGYVARIAAAADRDPDGYINTYTQLMQPGTRWGLNGGKQVWQHDTYNLGALAEAGVHYYRATGKAELLRVAVRVANHMCHIMGAPPRLPVITEHPLPEEAFVKLGELLLEDPSAAPTARPRDYIALAEFWLANRGTHEGRESLGAYAQDHAPVTEQQTVEGHAVRAALMCVGLVAVGHAADRTDFLDAARRLWDNMVQRRMHITGGVGAYADDEKFGPDYVLPHDAYLETCAAVASAFFSQRMALAFAEGRYADEVERVLYNGALCGVSLAGDSYFYENPLVGGPDRRRWSWHGCACCPPMFLKLMGMLPELIYAAADDALVVNQFIGGSAEPSIGGRPVHVEMKSGLPWDGSVTITLKPDEPREFEVRIRKPGWCRTATLALGGGGYVGATLRDGYLVVRRVWQPGDTLILGMQMPVERVYGHPRVAATQGRAALMRGPVVYCVEGINAGGQASDLRLSPEADLRAEHEPGLLGGVTVIRGVGRRASVWPEANALYATGSSMDPAKLAPFTAIPYYANANREASDMVVWLPEWGG